MRFDLEIPTNNAEISFIKEGYEIPNSAVPIIYHKNNTIDIFPSDFISAEIGYFPREFIVGGYEIVNGPEINSPKSDTFILTDIVKYSSVDGREVPLFYKHVIGEKVRDEAIKIIDFFGAPINKDLYIVNTKDNETEIYINKQNKILFIEYVSLTSVKKSILNLRPVYEESSWTDAMMGNVADKKYVFKNNTIITSHDGKLYVAYLSDTKLFRLPYGNIEDPWYVGILNASFSVLKDEVKYKYWVPEYYLQDLDTEFRYKLIKHKKCRKLLDNFIKTEYPIAKNATDNINVYVYDFYTNKLKYALSSNRSLNGTQYKDDIFYGLLNDVSFDGIINLPVKLNDNDVAYATFYTDEYYYEYKGIDIKNIFNNDIEYIAIFIKPDVLDTQKAVSHSLIGDGTEVSFKTIEEYNNWANENNYYTVAILTLINPYYVDNNEYIELRAYGNRILDKATASKVSIDVVYNDIINENIVLPTNDTVIASVNLNKLIKKGDITYTVDEDGKVSLNSYGYYFINKVNDILSKNLDASTYPIVEASIKE